MGRIIQQINWTKNKTPNQEGKSYAVIHLLEGYNQKSLSDYQRMAKMLKETFPFIKDSEIHCSHVDKSDRVYGFSIIWWAGELEVKDYDGYYSTTDNWNYCY